MVFTPIKKNHADTFKEYPILAFRRNKNLKDLIGQNKVVKNKIFKNIKQSKRKMFTLSFWKNNFCCKQMLNANIKFQIKTFLKVLLPTKNVQYFTLQLIMLLLSSSYGISKVQYPVHWDIWNRISYTWFRLFIILGSP